MVAVLKAMGLESDQEALQLAGCDGASASLLVPTLQDCKALSVFTQRQALEYLGELQVYSCALLTMGGPLARSAWSTCVSRLLCATWLVFGSAGAWSV